MKSKPSSNKVKRPGKVIHSTNNESKPFPQLSLMQLVALGERHLTPLRGRDKLTHPRPMKALPANKERCTLLRLAWFELLASGNHERRVNPSIFYQTCFANNESRACIVGL